jgi:succinate-acetate transporter protein
VSNGDTLYGLLCAVSEGAYLLLCSVLCNHNVTAVQGLGVTIDRCLMIFYGGLLRTLTSINDFQRKAFFLPIDYII